MINENYPIVMWLLIVLLSLQKVLSEGCGGDMTGPSGVISFPGAGQSEYKSNLDCYWTITVDEEMTMMIQFDMIGIEEVDDCGYDYVQIHDGDIDLGQYCGYTPPDPILSFTNVVTVHFHSDSSVNDDGFHLKYNETEPSSDLKICGIFDDEVGSFQSPDLDDDGYYENKVSCQWIIVSPYTTKVVQIYITDIDIPSDEHCSSDRLEILDDGDTILSILCGTQPPPIIKSTSHVVHVNFYSDGNVTGKGFEALFGVLDADGLCGGILTEPNVTLSSPDRDFNNRYDTESDCHWILAAPEDKVIQLVFEHVNMEGVFEESCYYDKVLVYDSVVEYGRVCGYAEQPFSFTSTSNVMIVYFHADKVGGFTGFKAVAYHISKANDSNEATGLPPSNNYTYSGKSDTATNDYSGMTTTSGNESDTTTNDNTETTTGLAPTTDIIWCIFCSVPVTAFTETSLNTTFPASTTETPMNTQFTSQNTETLKNTTLLTLIMESSLNTKSQTSKSSKTRIRPLTTETSLDTTGMNIIDAINGTTALSSTQTPIHTISPTSEQETTQDTMDSILNTKSFVNTTYSILSGTETLLNSTLPFLVTETSNNATLQISSKEDVSATTYKLIDINQTVTSKTPDNTGTFKNATTTDKSRATRSNSRSTETDEVKNTTIASNGSDLETGRPTQDTQATQLQTDVTSTWATETASYSIDYSMFSITSTRGTTIDSSCAGRITTLAPMVALLALIDV